MSFTHGFEKTAKGVLEEAGKVGKAALKGLKSSGDSTIKGALKLEGLGHISDAAKKSGGWGKSFSTTAGRKNLAEGVGKAAPSIAAGGAYAVGAKKIYDKTLKPKEDYGGYY